MDGSPLTCSVTLSKVICALVFRDDIAASAAYNGDAFTRDAVVKLIVDRQRSCIRTEEHFDLISGRGTTNFGWACVTFGGAPHDAFTSRPYARGTKYAKQII